MADSTNINDKPASEARNLDTQYASQVSSMSSFVNKMQSQTDKQIKGMDKRINNIMRYQLATKKQTELLYKSTDETQVANKELASSTSKVLRGLNSTIKQLAIGTQKITTATASSGANLISQYSKAISQDININKQNTVAMALAQSSPIFGYFAAKFMETDVFQSAASKIKDSMGNAINESLLAVKGVGQTLGDKIGDAFTRKEKLQLSAESKRYMGGDLKDSLKSLKRQGRMKQAARGGYVNKDGYVNVHAGEVITPIEKLPNVSRAMEAAKGENKSTTGQLNNINVTLSENFTLMRKLMKDSGRDATQSTITQTQEWQDKLLKATMEMRLAMVGMTSNIRVAWNRMLVEHPFFRGLRSTFDIMRTAFVTPFKFLFGMRGGYRRFLPTGNNAFQNINGTLGIIFTMFLPRLVSMDASLKGIHEKLTGSKSELSNKDKLDEKEYSLFGKINKFLTQTEEDKAKEKGPQKSITEQAKMAIADKMGLDMDAIQAFRVMFSKDNRKASIQNIKDKINPGIDEAKTQKQSLKRSADEAIFRAKYAADEAKVSLQSAYEKGRKEFPGAKNRLTDSAKGMYGSAKTSASGMFGKIKEKIPSFGVGGWLRKTGLFLGHKGEAIFPKEKLDTMLSSLLEITTNLKAAAKNKGEGILGAVKGKYKSGKSAISKFMDYLFPSFETKVRKRNEKFEKKSMSIRQKWTNAFLTLKNKSIEATTDAIQKSKTVRDDFKKSIEGLAKRSIVKKAQLDTDSAKKIIEIQNNGVKSVVALRNKLAKKGAEDVAKVSKDVNKKILAYQDKTLDKINKKQEKMGKRQSMVLKVIYARQTFLEWRQLRKQKKLAAMQEKLEKKRNKQIEKLNSLKRKIEERKIKFEEKIAAKEQKWKNKIALREGKMDAKVKMLEMKRKMAAKSTYAKLQAQKDKILFKSNLAKQKVEMKKKLAQMKIDTVAMKKEAKEQAKALKIEIKEMRAQQWEERKKLMKQRIQYFKETPKRLAEFKKNAMNATLQRIEDAKNRASLLKDQIFRIGSLGKSLNKHLPTLTKYARGTWKGITSLSSNIVKGLGSVLKKSSSKIWQFVIMGAGFIKDLFFSGMAKLGPMIASAIAGLAGAASSAGAATGSAIGAGTTALATKLGMGTMMAGGTLASGALGVGMMGFDAYKGVKKAKDWKTSKTSAGIGGALGGTGSGFKGGAKGALKGAAIGAAIGAPFGGPIGMAIGGAIGSIAGGVLGAIGGKNLAKGLDYIGTKIKNLTKGIWKFVTFPMRFMFKMMKNIFKDFKDAYSKDGMKGIIKEYLKKIVSFVTFPVRMMMNLTKGIRGTIIELAAKAAEKVPLVGDRMAKQIRKMKPEEDIASKAATNGSPESRPKPKGNPVAAQAIASRYTKRKQMQSQKVGDKVIIGKSLNGLDPEYRDKILQLGQEYSAITGKPLKINSAYRTPEQQAKLRKDFEKGIGNPAAKWSIHSTGHAVDIPSKQTGLMRSHGLDSKYGLSFPIGKEPWHVENTSIQGKKRRQLKAGLRNKQNGPMLHSGGMVTKSGWVKLAKGEVVTPMDTDVVDRVENAILGGKDIAKQGATMSTLQTRMLIKENQKAQKMATAELTKSNASSNNAIVNNISNIMSSSNQSVSQGGGGGNQQSAIFDPLAMQILEGDLS